MDLIKPTLKDESFLDDVKSRSEKNGHFQLWWLGQSGYLIHWDGIYLLIDPYLSDSLTMKYQATDKPHIRMSEKVVNPESLNFIDIVTSSHNHTDHLDGDTLIPLLDVNPDIKMIIPEANRVFVCDRIGKLSKYPLGLNDGESIELNRFHIHGIPAAHNEIERNVDGKCHYMGYIFQFGQWTIYHSGDTLWHDEIIKSLKSFSIDLAILPINGNKPERRVAGNLDYNEAVKMAQTIKARTVIPCHYDMFTFNTEDPEKFRDAALDGGIGFRILPIGGHFNSSMIQD